MYPSTLCSKILLMGRNEVRGKQERGDKEKGRNKILSYDKYSSLTIGKRVLFHAGTW